MEEYEKKHEKEYEREKEKGRESEMNQKFFCRKIDTRIRNVASGGGKKTLLLP